ncbi:hypothetical protein [Tenacibaculum soleae]|uniref:hypothetical protein n=1 Tax=Tenacibaculum soleae TaxID=447689 RepID=UPI0026E40797|nr:hypothetical protein [Tenacibaculum soleae]MDO6814007.1 hypothetical protein [Tenacibaculum soleae]
MKTFKELKIISEPEKLSTLVVKLQTVDLDRFLYNSEKTLDYAKMIGKKSDQVLTFESPEIRGAVAYVWLVADENELKITNITPNKSGQLSIEQYNSILDEFNDIIIKQNIDNQYQVIISSDSKTIIDYAGLKVSEKLQVWINSANKSTLNTHPLDFQRWASFLISAHKNQSELTSVQLEKYLIEEIGIPDDELVNKIAIDYEYGRDLLKEYDTDR